MRFHKIFTLAVTSLAAVTTCAESIKVDVCVYGGTSSGVIAAAAVAKAGKSVILIEQGRHLGGLSSGGLGETDIGNKMVIGGMSRDFYRRVGQAYGQPEAWKFAPSTAEKVFGEIIAENHIRVLLEHRIVDASKHGNHLDRIVVEHAPVDDYNAQTSASAGEKVTIEAREFIDAGYEGDLMARAKVSYTVGREATSAYGESLNGIRGETPKHQFPKDLKVDPYITPGDPSSGLLPLVKEADGGKPGDGDKRVQAYNFRVCVGSDTANQTPFMPPPHYDAAKYELLTRYITAMSAAKKPMTQVTFFKWDIMPGKKTDINNNGAISTDFIGESWDYPEADYAMRGKIWHANRDYVQGFFYYMATDPRSPESVRDFMSHWGMCKDEFKDTGGWPHQMYVREARRMVSDYVVTQKICKHEETADDSVGMAAYNMDSHNCNRIIRDGSAINEGDVQVSPSGPYPIAYRAIVPKATECDNLIVPVCLSATHIAYGSIRMEPVFMVLGQSSALAACQAIDDGKPVQQIDVKKLQATLLASGQVLAYTPPVKKKN
jgi:ribulose 1,5-bisphosphate synthetase/thiazole synthase